MNQRLDDIFAQAMVITDVPARAAYVERECAGDGQLRTEVEALLAAHDGAGNFMDAAPVVRLANTIPSEQAGDRIGRYKLLEVIGEGGFGVVWMAEQEEPVRRRVALKIIKLGMDTRQVVARFEAERQALALMEHPNIAQVFDGGATDTGRPYFVMELVKGIPITEYCDHSRLATNERLKLFVQVCRAVQHAHQKGIIHRDLKPTNILVTEQDGVPMPKVIDFGVAKATQARLTERTLFTGLHQMIGTPAYMSPEQAGLGALDIDTRSDIYSLGVLLYELLTGRTPFTKEEFEKAGLDEIFRLIREREPPKPSTRLSTLTREELTSIATRRQSEPARLNKLVRGDLDWIVMKALEKNRQRRYETANGLAADVQRYLSSEPVVARPPSHVYRVQKLVRRHKLAFALAASLVLGLGTIAVMFLSGREARVQAETARQNEASLRQTAQVKEETLQLYEWLGVDVPELGAEVARRKQWRKDDKLLGMERLADISDQTLTSLGAANPATAGLAVITQEGEIRIYSAAGEVTKQFRHPGLIFTAVGFSPSGAELLAGSDTGALFVWDLATDDYSTVATNLGQAVDRVTWLGNDQVVWGGYVRYWENDGKPVGQGQPVGAVLARSSGQLRWAFQGSVQNDYFSLAGAPDGSRLVVLEIPGQPRGACLLDGATGEVRHMCYDEEHGAGPLSVALSPDGNTLAVGYAPKDIVLWNARTGGRQKLLEGHYNWVVSLAFSADGKHLVSGAGDSTARVWNVESGKEIGRLRFDDQSTYVKSVGFTPGGDSVFALVQGRLVVASVPLNKK